MRRVLVFDRFDAQLFELNENDVFELTRHEVINGEHSLTITTTQVLDQGNRIVMQDGRGYWHEWVVTSIDTLHQSGNRPVGTYYCVWSVQPDLMGTRISAMPGVQTPCTAATALDAVLGGTSRWTRGTVTNTSTGGASMYDTDGWSGMATLIDVWGGEIDTSITVSNVNGNVTSRAVDLYTAQGEQTAKRRFDFGADLLSIKRTLPDSPLYCRITPRGMGEQTESGAYGRKVTISSVNGGLDYLENADMVDIAKLPDGNGGWEYPTLEIENSNCETPADLKAWAQSVLQDYTVPKVTYEVDVLQLAREGVDMQGVSLGDAVHIVDEKFYGLRLSGRVVEIVTDELIGMSTQLTIGYIDGGLSDRFSKLQASIDSVKANVDNLGETLSTADYIDSLLDRINAEINATGGYTYIVPGHGILTFDTAVADPLNPTEASQVVEIKGGSIRIANTKTAQGAWEWKTVFTSGHIAAELVTAANLITGSIGNANGGNYWDLDNNQLRLAPTTIIDDGDNTTIDDIANIEIGNANLVRNGDFASGDITYWTKANSTSTATIASDSDFATYLSYTQATAGSSYGIYTNTSTSFTHKSGVTYSLSFYAKADVENTLTVRVGTSSTAANNYFSAETIGTTWQRYEATITTTTTGTLRFFIGTAGTLYLANVMLVQGDKPMDFMPDPRDLYSTATAATAPAAMVRAYGSGVLVCRQGNTVGALVNADGSFDVVKVTWSNKTPTASTVYSTFGTTATIGKSDSSRTIITADAIEMYSQISTNTIKQVMRIGGSNNEITIGTRTSGSTVGNNSCVLGINCTASATNTYAVGYGAKATAQSAVAAASGATASGQSSFCAGDASVASASRSAAFNYHTTASGDYSAAFGYYTEAAGSYQFVCGKYNTTSTTHKFILGGGTGPTTRNNTMYIASNGDMWIAGTYSHNSDRRLKEHIAYLDEDACEFIRNIRPALFVKDGGRHLGFYAQDVQRADIWGTKTVEAQHTDESLDFDPLTLDYSALIAPLTAYAQNLEKRVESLEARLAKLEKKMDEV